MIERQFRDAGRVVDSRASGIVAMANCWYIMYHVEQINK
mgnify:CR=1 FL=1